VTGYRDVTPCRFDPLQLWLGEASDFGPGGGIDGSELRATFVAMPPTYDPRDASVLRDPHATFARLREEEPVHFSEVLSAWVLTDYASVERLLVRTAGASADRLAPFAARLKEPDRSLAEEVLRWLGLWMVFRDPPDHTRLRRHLATAVNPRIVERLHEPIREVATTLLDRQPAGETFDFYSEFAMVLPGCVVLDLLGVPRERLAEVQSWSEDMMVFVGSARGVDDKYARAKRGAYAMAELFQGLVDERKTDPRDDVISQLLASEIKGDRLTDEEIVASMMMLGNGAQGTTAHTLTNALIALVEHPDVLADLRANPEVLPTAVDEFLRYDGPVLSAGRIMVEDAAVGDRILRKDDRVFAMLTAANRDPAIFPEPDAIDLRRSPNRHLAFSKGPHFCLGAPLARLEVQIALQAIVERYDGIEITEPLVDIPWTNSLTSRGPTRLPMIMV
jgi:cytochrome P450